MTHMLHKLLISFSKFRIIFFYSANRKKNPGLVNSMIKLHN